ncbi:Di-copper centre-containing protein, partial [Ramicandelaber brevisporus]
MQRFHSFPLLKAISQLTLLLVLAVQFLFLTSLPQVHQVAAQCTTVVTRREFRTLSGDERSRYFAAVRALKGPEGSTRPNQFDRFAQLHTSQAWPIHSRPQFLPWHRAFTRDWEQALQRASGDPTVFQPYFDFTIDSQNPPASPLWSDDWISGNGRQGDQCVVNSSGTMGSLTMYYIGTGQVSQHCLRRNFNFQPYAPLSAVQTVMAEQADFQRFATNVENALHPHVHLNTGGDASGMEAPNDLIFFFHHTFVDYIWSTWQAMNNGARFWDYGGTN